MVFVHKVLIRHRELPNVNRPLTTKMADHEAVGCQQPLSTLAALADCQQSGMKFCRTNYYSHLSQTSIAYPMLTEVYTNWKLPLKPDSIEVNRV